ncbi:MAG: hypothetical protein ABSD31_17280 [Candidatus Binataceae bacterium]
MKNVQWARYGRLCLGAVNFRMSTSSFRVWILVSSLTVFVAVLTLWPAGGRTDVVLAPSTESSAGGALDAWLVTRGLISRGMIAEQSDSYTMTPPPGTEVDETQQTENRTGEVLTQAKSWNEMVDDGTIHIEVTTLSTYQFEVAFWLFPNHRKGCTMYQWTLYDHGRALQSAFWRNDAAVLRLAGAADLPHDLYPDSVPWVAFLRVLDAPRDGAEGTLHQQITPYSYVGQEVWATGSEQISVPAGSFSALKVTAQVDIATVMPNWPRFVLHVIKPVVPKNTLYFEATPPYRLLKQEGTTFVGGPEVTTELIRFYIAGAQSVVAAAPAIRTLGAPAPAALGSSSILK